MEIFKVISDIVSFVANSLTTITSCIILIVYVTKKNEIATAYRLILNYSYQTTLTELKGKLERLNEYKATDPTDLIEIRNILHEISGQFRGNARLHNASPKTADRIEKVAKSKNLTEPHKRSLISELRETLKNIQVHNFADTQEKRDE